MLMIRDEQMAVFRAALARRFRRDTVRAMRLAWPDATTHLDDAALDAIVEVGLAKAPLYDLVLPEHVAGFVGFLVRYGVDLDTAPRTAWAAAVLRKPLLGGGARLAELEAAARRAEAEGK